MHEVSKLAEEVQSLRRHVDDGEPQAEIVRTGQWDVGSYPTVVPNHRGETR